MKLFTILILFSIAAPSVAFADGVNSTEQKPCKTYKKRKKTTTSCPLPNVTVVQQCDCPEGPTGPQGPQGDKGDTGPQGNPSRTYFASIYPEVGYMGTAFWPKSNYAWAQGVALRFRSILNMDNMLLTQVGFAPGRDGAIMAQVAVQHWYDAEVLGFDLGAQAGLFGMVIGLNNNLDNGYYAGVSPQLVLGRRLGSFLLSFELGPVFGLAKYENSDTDPVVGILGSAGLGFNW